MAPPLRAGGRPPRQRGAVEDEYGLRWFPVPRVRAGQLDYVSFLRDFALQGLPVIVEGGGGHEAEAARRDWGSLDFFLKSPRVNRDQKSTFWTHPEPFDVEPARAQVTVGDALDELYSRGGWRPYAGPPADEQPRYLVNWAYDEPGGSVGLEEAAAPLPQHFGRQPQHLAESPALGTPGRKMKWLFLGEAGSASPTHLDVNNSSAWLWCAFGRKEWRFVHGGDFGHIPRDSRLLGRLPDLFEPDLERFPWLREVRLYHGVQEAGDAVYTPSSVLHGVRNLRFTISVTHNYVDAVNLLAVVRDRLERLDFSPNVFFDGIIKLQKFLGEPALETTLQAALGDEADAAEVEKLLRDHWAKEGLEGLRRRLEDLVNGSPGPDASALRSVPSLQAISTNIALAHAGIISSAASSPTPRRR